MNTSVIALLDVLRVIAADAIEIRDSYRFSSVLADVSFMERKMLFAFWVVGVVVVVTLRSTPVYFRFE